MMLLAVLRGGRRAAVAAAITLATISLLIAVQTLRAQQLVPSEPEAPATGEVLTATTPTTIIEQTDTNLYLPLISKPVPIPGPVTLNPISRPNSSNQWIISWSGGGVHTTGYELQESHTADFAAVTTYLFDVQGETAREANHPPSFRNVYYYRIRAVGPGGHGPWSGAQMVIGGYRDDFNDNTSGWAVRRTTYIEKVHTWYSEGQLVLDVDDRFDWGIFAPMMPAPAVPYAIEYRSKTLHPANTTAHGAVFGGDWTGQACPDYSTVAGVYEHDICFNRFYNANIIWYGPLKLLFERVDYLVWCPECTGSPMKRLSHPPYANFEVSPIPNVDPNGWNTFRVEVRSDGIRFFANGHQYAHSSDTTWIHEPYFGLFNSAHYYKPSTWRVEYYQVLPLD
jgi:hypothetical protein